MAKEGQRMRTMQRHVNNDYKKVELEHKIEITIEAIIDEAKKY